MHQINAEEQSQLINDAPPKKETGCCAPWRWFIKSPLKRYSFGIFLLFGLLTIIWLLMYISSMMTQTPDLNSLLFAGILVIIMSIYALNLFRILLSLKQEIDHLSQLNKAFRIETTAINKELDRLRTANEQLSKLKVNLYQSNQRLKLNLERFTKCDATLRTLNIKNRDGLEKLQQNSICTYYHPIILSRKGKLIFQKW